MDACLSHVEEVEESLDGVELEEVFPVQPARSQAQERPDRRPARQQNVGIEPMNIERHNSAYLCYFLVRFTEALEPVSRKGKCPKLFSTLARCFNQKGRRRDPLYYGDFAAFEPLGRGSLALLGRGCLAPLGLPHEHVVCDNASQTVRQDRYLFSRRAPRQSISNILSQKRPSIIEHEAKRMSHRTVLMKLSGGVGAEGSRIPLF